MKTLLFILAIILMAAGFAVGLMNLFSPGTVTLGLNYDVAATLFTGGCLLLGLGVVAEAMASRPTVNAGNPPSRQRPDIEDELPEFMSPVSRSASAAAAGAGATGAAVAAGAGSIYADAASVATDVPADSMEFVTQTSDTISGTVDEVASATAGAASSATAWTSKTRDDLSSMFDEARDDASNIATDAHEAAGDAVSQIGETASEAIDAVQETAADAVEAVEETAADAVEAVDYAVEEPQAAVDDAHTQAGQFAHDVEADVDAAFGETDTGVAAPADMEDAIEEPAEALAPEDALFVVEERTIRDRPARLLSDGTVEAETDEGWMRFENVEHVEEYLDAMRATA